MSRHGRERCLLYWMCAREKCVLPDWLPVVLGGCWLLLGEIGYKESAAAKT